MKKKHLKKIHLCKHKPNKKMSNTYKGKIKQKPQQKVKKAKNKKQKTNNNNKKKQKSQKLENNK